MVVRIWLPKAILHCKVTADIAGGERCEGFHFSSFFSCCSRVVAPLSRAEEGWDRTQKLFDLDEDDAGYAFSACNFIV